MLLHPLVYQLTKLTHESVKVFTESAVAVTDWVVLSICVVWKVPPPSKNLITSNP